MRLALSIEARLKAICSDRNQVAFILLSLMESAFADPQRDSEVNVTLTTSLLPSEIPTAMDSTYRN